MSCEINCRPLGEFVVGEEPEVEPYGDISGIGVMIGFLAPAYLSVIIITIYYISEHDPRIDPYRSAQNPGQVGGRPNPIDQLLYRFFRGRKTASVTNTCSCPQDRGESEFSNGLSKCVLLLADIQIVAGLAILISGYIALPRCLSLYHWQMVVLMAWFSTITHLCALTFLRNHFYTHPRQRSVRLSLMVSILVLLIVALVPLSDFESTPRRSTFAQLLYGNILPTRGAHRSEHAICYLSHGFNRWTSYDSFVTHLFLLVWGSVSRALKLFPTRAWGSRVRARLAHFLQRPIRMARKRISVDKVAAVPMVHVPLLAAYITARFYLDYLVSVAAEIFYLYFVITWGSYRMIALRIARGPEGENTWTFGQVVPVILLLGPIFALWDTFQMPFKSTDSFHGTTQSMRSKFRSGGIFDTVWKRIKEAWYELKERASDFPTWSQALGERRLLHKKETPLERNERITALLASQLDHNAVPLWHEYLFVYIIVHWLSAVFVIIVDGINPINSDAVGLTPGYNMSLSMVPFTQLFSTPPMMMFMFLWCSYLAKIYAWGAATVMLAFVATTTIVVTAYPWWDASLLQTQWLYIWPNYMVGLLAYFYLTLGLPVWYGVSLYIDLFRDSLVKMRKNGGRREESRAAMELAENNQPALDARLLSGSSRNSTSGYPSTSDIEDLGSGRGGGERTL